MLGGALIGLISAWILVVLGVEPIIAAGISDLFGYSLTVNGFYVIAMFLGVVTSLFVRN